MQSDCEDMTQKKHLTCTYGTQALEFSATYEVALKRVCSCQRAEDQYYGKSTS
jgi:hypothetical protein